MRSRYVVAVATTRLEIALGMDSIGTLARLIQRFGSWDS